MTKYWEEQMAHGPTNHYYHALKQMVDDLKKVHAIERVFEIGTGWGISGSVFIEAGVKELVTIDPNLEKPYVRLSVREIESKRSPEQVVIYFPKKSSEILHSYDIVGYDDQIFAQQTFDLVFIDGRHDYDSVKHDLELASTLIKPGGIIICDDYSHPKNGAEYGVKRAVDDYVANKPGIGQLIDYSGNGLFAIIH